LIAQGTQMENATTRLEDSLFAFQRYGADTIVKALSQPPHAFILADEQGTGKTHTTLAAIKSMGDKVGQVLIVCPASGREEWERIIQHYTTSSYTVVIGRDCLRTRVKYLITSYNAFWRYQDDITQMSMVVLDEFHRMKNPGAKRTQAILEMDVKYKLLVSGTPLLNRPAELWTGLHFMLPDEYPSYSSFVRRYCHMIKVPVRAKNSRRTFNIEVPKGSKNEAELRGIIKPKMIRRLRSEVLDQLPPRTTQVLYTDLGGKQKKAYEQKVKTLKDLAERAYADMGALSVARLKAFGELRMLCQMDRETGSSSKLDLMEEVLQDIVAGGHKAFVITPFVAVAEEIHQRLKWASSVLVTGQTDQEAATKRRRSFQAGKQQVYVGTIHKNMESLTLTEASFCIFVGKDLVPAVNKQVADRIYRIGQEKPVTVIELLTRETVETRIEEMLMRKNRVFDMIVNGKLDKNAINLLLSR